MKKFATILAITLLCITLTVALTACAPRSNPDIAYKTLVERGFSASKIDADQAELPENVRCVVKGTKSQEKNGVVIYYYTSKDAAKKAWEAEYKDHIDEIKDSVVAMLGCEKKNVVVDHYGKMIYYGTKAAINQAK